MIDELPEKEKPEEVILEDHEDTYEWLQDFRQKKHYEEIHGQRKSAADHKNVFVFDNSDDYED